MMRRNLIFGSDSSRPSLQLQASNRKNSNIPTHSPACPSKSGVSPDTDLFMAMFLICLPHSMREAVGAENHKTAVDAVRAADALWDARGGHDPMVAATTTNRSRSPAPTGRKTSYKRNGNARSKSHPPSHPAFHSFQNPANGMCKFHNYYSNRAHRCIAPCTFLEY
jgi:hypothetical protein